MLRNRNPDETRERLLDAAMSEIHRHGFRAASLKRILEDTGLTKGAFYHHFPSKQAMGYAVVEERVHTFISRLWLEPLKAFSDPVTGIRDVANTVSDALEAEKLLSLGCPLNNLALEMSYLDDGFRQRLNDVYLYWQRGITEALCRGQGAGIIRPGIDCRAIAWFIVATIEGAIGLCKCTGRRDDFTSTIETALACLETCKEQP